MINNEIIVKQAELGAAVMSLKVLRLGTPYRNMNADMAVMSTSISETTDAMTEMFRILQQSEEVFQELLEKTIQAMEAAGISFQEADASAGQLFEDLPYAVIM